jgi:hypothetical protein
MSQRKQFAVGLLVVALLLGLALPVMADQLKGKLAGVNVEKNQIVVTENFKNWTFTLDRDAQVFLNDRQSKLQDLQAGDEAIITFTRQGERLSASVVRCMRK